MQKCVKTFRVVGDGETSARTSPSELQCTCKEILPNGVRYTDKDGAEHFVEVDTVISAVGMKPRRQEAQSFYGIAPQTMMLGDCDRVGKILQANQDAYFFAANL